MPAIEPVPLSSPDRRPLKDSPVPRKHTPECISEISKIKLDLDKPPASVREIENKPVLVDGPIQKQKSQAEAKIKSEYDNSQDDPHVPLVQHETLRQILELDEDDEREFSKDMARDYYEQAERTFNEMDQEFSKKNLPKLSSLGHYLKGSSAALGLSRVQSTCEKIQHCGAKRDEKLGKDLLEEDALEIMGNLLKTVRLQYKEAKEWLVDFFENDRTLEGYD